MINLALALLLVDPRLADFHLELRLAYLDWLHRRDPAFGNLQLDFGEITRSANYNVVIGETEQDVADRLDRIEEHARRWFPEKADDNVASWRGGPLVGTPEQIVETLTGLRDQGLGYAIGYFPFAATDRDQLELFQRQVIPALQS